MILALTTIHKRSSKPGPHNKKRVDPVHTLKLWFQQEEEEEEGEEEELEFG